MTYFWKALRVAQFGSGIDVVGFFEQKGGVLDGQTLKKFIDNFSTEEEARAAHPDVIGFSSPLIESHVSLVHLPNEDDPVPGGMYPDDI
jgi:galactokinase/mevalonate kinase-like predicted kinase